jgi:hypothetical protein
MNLKNIKVYLPFIISITLFLILIGSSVYIYSNWHNEKSPNGESVEINLPVINWGAYSNLSKKYEPDNINVEP